MRTNSTSPPTTVTSFQRCIPTQTSPLALTIALSSPSRPRSLLWHPLLFSLLLLSPPNIPPPSTLPSPRAGPWPPCQAPTLLLSPRGKKFASPITNQQNHFSLNFRYSVSPGFCRKRGLTVTRKIGWLQDTELVEDASLKRSKKIEDSRRKRKIRSSRKGSASPPTDASAADKTGKKKKRTARTKEDKPKSNSDKAAPRKLSKPSAGRQGGHPLAILKLR